MVVVELSALMSVGADFHREMAATAPGEKLNPPYDIKLVFCAENYPVFSLDRSQSFVLRKINKNCCHHCCTF